MSFLRTHTDFSRIQATGSCGKSTGFWKADCIDYKEASISGHKVTIFRPYSFQVGQKIKIDGSRRGGDWEVVDISEHKVTLRCPVSNKQFTWDLFCYFVEEKDNCPWPMEK